MMPLISTMLGNEIMAEKLALALGAERGATMVWRFPDGESYVRVESAVEGRRAAIVHMLDRSGDKLIPLLLLVAAARENGVADVDLAAPYLAHMRRDSCFQSGETVNARHFAAWLSREFDWLAIVDPHSHRITKLSQVYVISTRHVHAVPAVVAWLRAHMTRPALVDPDEESNQWVVGVASRVDTSMVMLHKVCKGDRNVEVPVLDVERWCDHMPVLVDDIVSTGRTMAKTTGHLWCVGLAAPVRIAIHAVFSGNAIQDLESTEAGLVVSCDTVIHPISGISVVPDPVPVVRELMQDSGGAT